MWLSGIFTICRTHSMGIYYLRNRLRQSRLFLVHIAHMSIDFITWWELWREQRNMHWNLSEGAAVLALGQVWKCPSKYVDTASDMRNWTASTIEWPLDKHFFWKFVKDLPILEFRYSYCSYWVHVCEHASKC